MKIWINRKCRIRRVEPRMKMKNWMNRKSNEKEEMDEKKIEWKWRNGWRENGMKIKNWMNRNWMIWRIELIKNWIKCKIGWIKNGMKMKNLVWMDNG